MSEFGILTNRKRAAVALLHSVVFLVLASWQMSGGGAAPGMLRRAQSSAGVWALCGIYLTVSAVLGWLFMLARRWLEKLYFALCTASASSGLLRTIVGDNAFHAGRSLRVAMLACAVLVGIMIAWQHAQIVRE